MKKYILHTDDSAPYFTIKDVNGLEFNLAKFKGKKNVVLVFLRYFACPLCQNTIQQFKDSYHEFSARDTEVVIFIQSSLTTILENCDVNAIPFRMIPDQGELIYHQYGVGSGNALMIPQALINTKKALIDLNKGYKKGKGDANAWQLPGEFVIDKEGIIRFAYIGKDMGDNLLPSELLPYIKYSK